MYVTAWRINIFDSFCLKILFFQFIYGIVRKPLSIKHLNFFEFPDEFPNKINGFCTMLATVRVMPDKPDLELSRNVQSENTQNHG